MFGYVLPSRDKLTEEEQAGFQAMYCGLCHTLRERYGFAASMILNYDLTFLAVLLSEGSEPEVRCRRCAAHPCKGRCAAKRTTALEKAAACSVILAYWQIQDGIADSRGWKGLKYRVVAISRNNETIIPKFDTKFKYHDLVFIISKREGMEMLMKYIGKKNIEVDSVMILGGSPIGEMVARQLSRQLASIKLIEMNKEKCQALSEDLPSNVIVVNGDGRNSDLLLEESIRDYQAFVAVTNNSETNILACVAAKNLGVERVIAEVENLEYIKLAERMGVDAVVNKKLITAGKIFKFTLSNKVRFVKYMSGTNAEVLEYIVAPDTAITKKTLKDMNFPKNAIIGGVIRGNESFIAVGDTQIQAYDRVAVFALPDVVKEVDRFFK